MALTDIEICSLALQGLGDNPIQSFSESEPKSKACGQIYNWHKKRILSSFPWKFSFKFAQLSRLTAAPLMQWKYKYTLPPDKISDNMFEVFESEKVEALSTPYYTIMDNVLMSNIETIWVKYQYEVNENTFPEYFSSFMVNVMMAEIAFLITNSSSERETHRRIAYGTPSEQGRGGMFATTAGLDSQGAPVVKINDFVLLEGRYGDGY